MDVRRLDHLRVATSTFGGVVVGVAGLVLAVALVVVLPNVGRADPSVPPLPTPSATATSTPSAPPSPTESPSLGPAPSIGPAVQAKRTVTRTCRAVVTRYYESTDGGPFRLVDVRRVPTGRLCPPRVAGSTASSAPVPTVVAGGL